MNTSGSSGPNASGMFDISNSGEERGIGAQQANKATEKPGTARMTPSTGKGDPMSPQPGTQGVDTETVVIEVLTQEGTQRGEYPYSETEPSGFQWWYVPAIAVPIAAAAGATVTALIMRRRRQEMKAAQLAAAAAAARNWVDALRLRRLADQANDLLQQSMRWGRQTSQLTPQQINTWRDLLNQQFTEWRRQTSQLTPQQLNAWRNLLNQQVREWRAQVPSQVNAWRGLATQQANQWRDVAVNTAQPVVGAARSRALASRNSATQAFSGASRSVNATASHTLAFSLGAVLSAMLAYVGLSRQRTANAELENSHTATMHEEPIL